MLDISSKGAERAGRQTGPDRKSEVKRRKTGNEVEISLHTRLLRSFEVNPVSSKTT
jgi:hypothetical protein